MGLSIILLRLPDCGRIFVLVVKRHFFFFKDSQVNWKLVGDRLINRVQLLFIDVIVKRNWFAKGLWTNAFLNNHRITKRSDCEGYEYLLTANERKVESNGSTNFPDVSFDSHHPDDSHFYTICTTGTRNPFTHERVDL